MNEVGPGPLGVLGATDGQMSLLEKSFPKALSELTQNGGEKSRLATSGSSGLQGGLQHLHLVNVADSSC